MNYKCVLMGDSKVFYKFFDITQDSGDFLKNVLKNEYGILDYEIYKNKNGKPYLKNIDIYFSISHKNNIIGIAFSNQEIGFDIEFFDEKREYGMNLIKDWFTLDEINHINNDVVSMIKVWSMKESYLKLIGGKLVDIKTFSCLGINNVCYVQNTIDNYFFTICFQKVKK